MSRIYDEPLNEPNLIDSYLVHPEFDVQERHPLHYTTIREFQQADAALINAARNAPNLFQRKKEVQ
jgi:hypothetical protein